ncbi:LysR family transcriptional regulator [Pokkaliibacter sp. CJK22405]|uniref:LysR family transcriptional regulator n=1 Tax=Pokkaliibacter sp. CJK22405 TaxID=3384615 RepID=UPI00398520A2
MRLRHVELLQAILQTGSISSAAQLLNISQPAASKALSHAEHQLGYKLFHRVKGRLVPSEQALRLAPHVEKVYQALSQVQRLSQQLGQPIEHPYRVVATPSLTHYLMPRVMGAWYASAMPSMALASLHSYQMMEALMLEEGDVGLTLHQQTHPLLHSQVVTQGKLGVIAPVGTWSDAQLRQPISLADLLHQPLVGYAQADPMHAVMLPFWEQAGVLPNYIGEVQNYQLARSLVEEGQAWAILDEFTLAGGQQRFEVRWLKESVHVALYAVCRLQDKDSQLFSRFRQILMNTFEPMRLA